MTGTILAFITYIGWGTGDIFGVFASRKIGAYKASAFIFISGLVLASLYIPFALADLGKITLSLFLLNFLLGAPYIFGNLLLNEAFKRSSASLVGIIVQSFPAVVLILSALIFKDAINAKQILWTIIIFSGIFLCTIDFGDFKKGKLFADSGVKLALIAAAMFSIYFTFLRVFADVYGWFWPNYISFMTFPIALMAYKMIFKSKEVISVPTDKKVLGATFLSALLLRSGDIALNSGISKGFASIVTPIAGASPTLFLP
jgi:drug/metabolite transporter (DMT)-like permease